MDPLNSQPFCGLHQWTLYTVCSLRSLHFTECLTIKCLTHKDVVLCDASFSKRPKCGMYQMHCTWWQWQASCLWSFFWFISAYFLLLTLLASVLFSPIHYCEKPDVKCLLVLRFFSCLCLTKCWFLSVMWSQTPRRLWALSRRRISREKLIASKPS